MAKRETQRKVIKSGGVPVTDPATASFVSEPIPMPEGAWSLNAYITSLVVSGVSPTYTIFVSNSGANGSEQELDIYAIDVDIANVKFVYKASFPGEFMVIVYSANGATGGTKVFELFTEK